MSKKAASKKPAARAAKAVNMEDAAAFSADILAVFLKWNGRAWKVREAGTIAVVVNLVTSTASAILQFKR